MRIKASGEAKSIPLSAVGASVTGQPFLGAAPNIHNCKYDKDFKGGGLGGSSMGGRHSGVNRTILQTLEEYFYL